MYILLGNDFGVMKKIIICLIEKKELADQICDMLNTEETIKDFYYEYQPIEIVNSPEELLAVVEAS